MERITNGPGDETEETVTPPVEETSANDGGEALPLGDGPIE